MKYQEIEIEKLVPHPANFPGREQKMEEEMLRSIEEHGVLVPLMVRELESGEYQILAGHRRFTALQNMDQQVDHVPCVVRQMDDVEAVDFVVLENLQRSELDPMDEAYAVKVLMEQHGDSGEVADVLSRSAVWVKLRQGLLDLGDEAQEAVRERDLSLGAAAVILKCEEEDRARAEELVLFPDFQRKPLNSIQAAETVNAVILEPARQRAEWENKRDQVAFLSRQGLRDRFGKRAEGLNVQAAKFEDIAFYQSDEFIDVRDEVPVDVVTEHAPQRAELGALCDEEVDELRWVDLAQRHGLAVTVVPWNDSVKAVVSKKILVDGEKSRMEHGMEPWIADAVSKAIDAECQEDDSDAEESDGGELETTDPAEKLGDSEALAKELEWCIEQSRDGVVREKVEFGAAVNYALGVSDDCPRGFENLCNDEMSAGARRHLLRVLCWAQGVDFWK